MFILRKILVQEKDKVFRSIYKWNPRHSSQFILWHKRFKNLTLTSAKTVHHLSDVYWKLLENGAFPYTSKKWSIITYLCLIFSLVYLFWNILYILIAISLNYFQIIIRHYFVMFCLIMVKKMYYTKWFDFTISICT